MDADNFDDDYKDIIERMNALKQFLPKYQINQNDGDKMSPGKRTETFVMENKTSTVDLLNAEVK